MFVYKGTLLNFIISSIGLKEKALAESRFDLKRLEDQNARFKARVSLFIFLYDNFFISVVRYMLVMVNVNI